MWKWFVFLFSTTVYSAPYIDAILTDIEGTTTSISFVHDVLFPYAKQNVFQYLKDHRQEPEVENIMQQVQQIACLDDGSIDTVATELLHWMEQDKKITPLKSLQGMMWRQGYKEGFFKGHVYRDAYEGLLRFKALGLPLYVYSSGSIPAQKLLFGYSLYGDMTPLFSGYFDTRIGGKKDPLSYEKIAQEIGVERQRILFLTDSLEEIDAAKKAGLQVIWVEREKKDCNPSSHSVSSFDEIIL